MANMQRFVCSGCVDAGLAKNLEDSMYFLTGDKALDSGEKLPGKDTECGYCHSKGTIWVIDENGRRRRARS